VNIAVTLGVDPATPTVTKRKATLLVDTARAFLQWGKHEKAYLALRAAEEAAQEERVCGRGRPTRRGAAD
jgi:hypothetical protein